MTQMLCLLHYLIIHVPPALQTSCLPPARRQSRAPAAPAPPGALGPSRGVPYTPSSTGPRDFWGSQAKSRSLRRTGFLKETQVAWHRARQSQSWSQVTGEKKSLRNKRQTNALLESALLQSSSSRKEAAAPNPQNLSDVSSPIPKAGAEPPGKAAGWRQPQHREVSWGHSIPPGSTSEQDAESERSVSEHTLPHLGS